MLFSGMVATCVHFSGFCVRNMAASRKYNVFVAFSEAFIGDCPRQGMILLRSHPSVFRELWARVVFVIVNVRFSDNQYKIYGVKITQTEGRKLSHRTTKISKESSFGRRSIKEHTIRTNLPALT